jgi:hypothetical protein
MQLESGNIDTVFVFYAKLNTPVALHDWYTARFNSYS